MTELRLVMDIIQRIFDKDPPEKEAAILLFLYGCKEEEFVKKKVHIDLPEPTLVKIQNHLRDEWRKKS